MSEESFPSPHNFKHKKQKSKSISRGNSKIKQFFTTSPLHTLSQKVLCWASLIVHGRTGTFWVENKCDHHAFVLLHCRKAALHLSTILQIAFFWHVHVKFRMISTPQLSQSAGSKMTALLFTTKVYNYVINICDLGFWVLSLHKAKEIACELLNTLKPMGLMDWWTEANSLRL